MKPLFVLLPIALTFGLTEMQGADFQNLDFESPAFVPVASPYTGSMDPSAALPGWTMYWGSSLAPYVLYDNLFLDSRGISIFDGNQTSPSAPLQGQYSLLLQGGFTLAGPPNRDSASIAQTGFIPSWAKSLTFQTGPSHYFEVRVAGQILQDFGGKVDISPFSGQEVEIKFTAPPLDPPGLAINNFIIDNIAFSTAVVPEPTTLALLVLGFFLVYLTGSISDRRSARGQGCAKEV